MNFNEFAKEVHDNSIKHGWWEEERSFAEIIALCHSELSEALEEYRDGKPMAYFIDEPIECCLKEETDFSNWHGQKPEGIAVELADCVIRILDYCGKEDIDVESTILLLCQQKITCTLPKLIAECHCSLSWAYDWKHKQKEIMGGLITCILMIFSWCEENHIDIEEIIKIKHEYNKTRPYKHGGKVI